MKTNYLNKDQELNKNRKPVVFALIFLGIGISYIVATLLLANNI